MTLYKINEKIREFLAENVDPETGEILNTEALEKLEIERMEKLENYALVIKNYRAAMEAIKAEEDNLKTRRKSLEKNVDKLSEILKTELSGEELSTARVKISYRKSQSTEIIDISKIPKKYLKFTPEAKKLDIKAAINAGLKVRGAAIVEKISMIIK